MEANLNPRNMWLDFHDAMAAIREERGRGIRIAVVDSGIEASHPDLTGMELRDDVQVVEDGMSVSSRLGDGSDLNGHGTAVASVIYRMAPEAEIGSFRVLDARSSSKTDVIREGVRQALDRGYHVINCSFGCGLPDHVLKYKAWVDEAYLKGVHLVAACNNEDYMRPEWPGYFPSVVTVNFGRISDGNRLYFRSGHLVEFFAAGVDIEVAWKGGRRKKLCGSSFAAPHATALLARILSRYRGLPPLQAKALLLELARPWDDSVAGENVLNAGAAPAPPPAPRVATRPPGLPAPPVPPAA